MDDQKEITTWKKRAGLGLIQVLIVIVAFGLIYKTVSIVNSVGSSQAGQNPYYTLGYEHGVNKALGKTSQVYTEPTDLVDKSEYTKGYRQGWDSAQ